MRKLAHIEKIEWKRPIEGADRIELVGVLGWQCIAKKDEFQVGDLCVYVEIDSVVDKDNPDFAFLEDRKYKIKTIKMKGQLSQGIVFPLDILHGKTYGIGEDITKVLNITEIEDKLPEPKQKDPVAEFKKHHKKLMKNKLFAWLFQYKWLRKLVVRNKKVKRRADAFPSWIVKTDETRLQAIPQILEGPYKGESLIVTEKVDGTSGTFAIDRTEKKEEFIVCSRNRRLEVPKTADDVDDVYNEIAFKYNIKAALDSIADERGATRVVLQGEILGEGIQDNKYGLKGHDIYAFNLIIDGQKVESTEGKEIMDKYGIKWVPILDTDFHMLPTVDEMILNADGASQLCDTLREGLVIRSHDNMLSFKCVSNKFLIKHGL